MKTIAIISLLFFSFIRVTAQVPHPALSSLKDIGGDGDDEIGPQVINTWDGGFIISIGSTSISGPLVDSCSSTHSNTDIFQKYNADGSILEWSKCYEGSFGDTGFSFIFPLADGSYVLGGSAEADTHEFLIHKENADGSVSWSKAYGDSAEAILESMVATTDGGYIMFGEAYYTNSDFTIHYGSEMNSDFILIKVDSNGNKIWSKVIGGTGNQTPAIVIGGTDGDFYIIGSTTSDDHDCSGNHGDSSGSADAYLARLDDNGNIIWHKDLGGSGDDAGNSCWPDGKGGVIVGATSGSHDGDVTHQVNYNGNNMWSLDVDSSGNILWNYSYGGGGDEFTRCICKATDGSIWIAGDNDYRDSFEVDTFYGGNYDAWFVHTDSLGNFLSAKVLGSTGQDEGFMVYPLSNGSVIAGGYYQSGNGSFSASWGQTDGFLATFSPWTEKIKNIALQNNDVTIYPNPALDVVTIKTREIGKYILSITDVLGQRIYESRFDSQINISISGWQEGLYCVQVKNESGYINVQKLLVQ